MIDVVAAVIRSEGRYLACRRRPERGGTWEFPGGKVEDGETPESALIREVAEELGVEITVGPHIVTIERPDAGIRLASYLAELIDSRPTVSTDHDLLSWLPPSQLSNLDWTEADLATVRELESRPG